MHEDWIKSKADEDAWQRGCRPDPPAAERVRDFFSKFLRHSKGEFAGKPFELLPWQWEDIVKPLFGWKRPDGTRRYRRAYIEVPKKNGKSTLCAGLTLYMLVADNEPGAEVYSAAADRKQASIIFNEVKTMIDASPALTQKLSVLVSQKRVTFSLKHSWYEAMSAEAPTKEGVNIHGLVFDELHAQKTRGVLWDTLTYGGASRRQPLLIAITTAGYDRQSICWEQHEYTRGIIEGLHFDPSYFAYIRAAEPTDDWTADSTWRKANPSYGVTLKKISSRKIAPVPPKTTPSKRTRSRGTA